MFNEICPIDSGFGAGVVLDYPPDELLFTNNVVTGNYFSGNGQCYGGGICIWDGNPALTNNLIVKNRGTIGGGIWMGVHFCDALIINNTIADNMTTIQGGSIDAYNSSPAVVNSILWGNYAPVSSEIHIESGDISVRYSSIAGG
jgi:hypothetical protein